MKTIAYPIDGKLFLRNKHRLVKNFTQSKTFVEKKIAILGGSTTNEIVDSLRVFLLYKGICPEFYVSEYNKYSEDVFYNNDKLNIFKPDIIYIHITNVNIKNYPVYGDSIINTDNLFKAEQEFYINLWDTINAKYACPIIQNNFDLPLHRPLGNLEAYDNNGVCYYINKLNMFFSQEAGKRNYLYIQDINWLSAKIGLKTWFNLKLWYSYKYAVSYEAIPLLANNLASIISAIYGLNKKNLVLDLDNTIWGGVIGDDGIGSIQIGDETPEGEAYKDFQKYLKKLKDRGVILSIVSKNNYENAIEGLDHPENILKQKDFAIIKANWDNKDNNIVVISKELNLGLNSFIFIDDNPAERHIVNTNLPSICVPNIGSDITDYITILDETGELEPIAISNEDRLRSDMYLQNVKRSDYVSTFDKYEDYLLNLKMQADISKFMPLYYDRIAQLTNKTNQFNLTTKRYSLTEIVRISEDPNWLTLQGRLTDKFGDNGIVSLIAGYRKGDNLIIDIWLMSCRVLKRCMEHAMLDALVLSAKKSGFLKIIGLYIPSAKNSMVKNLFYELGFILMKTNDNKSSEWYLDIDSYILQNKAIDSKVT